MQYGPPPPYPPPPAGDRSGRSRTLGVIALIIVVLGMTVPTALAFLPTAGDAGMPWPLQLGLAIGGLAVGGLGFVLSILAIVQNRGRAFGIAGVAVATFAAPNLVGPLIAPWI